jgi:hypothetical protein
MLFPLRVGLWCLFIYTIKGENIGIDLVKQTRENKADSVHLVTMSYLMREPLSKAP